MDLSRNLKVLGITSLETVSLGELEGKVDLHVGTEISKQQVLNTYLGWLRGKFVKDLSVKGDSQLDDWIVSLRAQGFARDQIEKSFKDWQKRAAQDEPSNLRRYLMVEQELFQGLDQQYPAPPLSQYPPQNSSQHLTLLSPRRHIGGQSAPTENTYSTQDGNKTKKHRRKKARKSSAERTGANDLPVGNRRSFQQSTAREVIEIEDNDPEEPSRQVAAPKTPTRAPHDNTSAISSRPGTNEPIAVPEIILLDTPSPPKLRAGHFDPFKESPTKEEHQARVKMGAANKVPGPDYVCYRCRRGGHWINDCPTNLDPRYDNAPGPSYRCHFCKQRGEHFSTLCPNNPNSDSVSYQRKVAGINSTSTAGHRDEVPERADYYHHRSNTYRLDSSPRSGCNDYPSRYDRSPKSRHSRSYREREDSRSRKSKRDRSPYHSHRGQERPSPYSSYRGRDRSSRSPGRSSPGRGRRANTRDSTRSHKGDIYRPGNVRFDIPNDRLAGGDRAGNEGRLSYENDDIFLIDSKPLSTKAKAGDSLHRASTVPTNATNNPTTSDTPVSVQSDPADLHWAKVKADEFVRALNDEWNAVAVSKLYPVEEEIAHKGEEGPVVDPVDSDDDTNNGIISDPTLEVDQSGKAFRVVTNPPFNDIVIRLFKDRSNPIITPHPKRMTAAQLNKELYEKQQTCDGHIA